MDLLKERLLTLSVTHQYVSLPPKEIEHLYTELKHYLNVGDPNLSEVDFMTLTELLFNLAVYMGEDTEAEVIYRTLTDRFGHDSPKLHIMKATLLQITEGDLKAKEYLNKLLNSVLEFDTDSVDYLCVSKKLLAINSYEMHSDRRLAMLIDLLEKFPLDGELWWKLAMEYYSNGHFEEAAYCLEDVLIISPFNYNAFAQLSEILFYKAIRTGKTEEGLLEEALDNALRAVELSETCLKGWALVRKISSLLRKDKLFELSFRKLNEIGECGNPADRKTAKYILKSL
ncbi:Emc2p Ecym_4670 [Eremothecium cymbalariae DBVPG|uniref:ER membrane protein complex subunit 2 n=1 Tax=Eremothecium cymbalariae (strain CBS 270.75 / DBVPG 7215 / KCTC 17166 / NRRL Y-17582) TaxID=931890 RepID=G8JSG9_ERECY|nr:hypothetical protein Ecym_4670 [Eremothecium cymbalariae DBVPG\